MAGIHPCAEANTIANVWPLKISTSNSIEMVTFLVFSNVLFCEDWNFGTKFQDLILCWSCEYTKCMDFEVKLVFRNIMNIVNIEVFQYNHSRQHSFCSFDVTYIVCDENKFLHNLLELIICMSFLSSQWNSLYLTCFWCLFICSFLFWIITYIHTSKLWKATIKTK